MSAYSEASKAVFEVFDDTTPLVEGISIDEAFLDVGGLRRVAGTPVEIAVRLRRDVRERVGLPITVGVARTKFLAKVASAVASPTACWSCHPSGELAFLHPLPGRAAVGRRAGDRREAPRPRDRAPSARSPRSPSRRWSPCSVGGRAATSTPSPTTAIPARRGRPAPALDRLAARARPEAEVDGRRSTHRSSALVDRVTRRMRTAGRVGRTVVLRLRFDDFVAATRSHTLPRPTAHTDTILATARAPAGRGLAADRGSSGLTLVGVAVGNLDDDDAVQLTLPFDRHSGSALDARPRRRARALRVRRPSPAPCSSGRDPGMTVPMLPD